MEETVKQTVKAKINRGSVKKKIDGVTADKLTLSIASFHSKTKHTGVRDAPAELHRIIYCTMLPHNTDYSQ